ncbi:type 1 glutamine amidotransferase [Candidatus Gottesmanbacteria bacterium]|nr:type 1 glutamine amidotransferase [Candidatus Gottesmanbacteria bacterium]
MKVLVFQHVSHEHPGSLSEFAKEFGVQLPTISFWEKYSIPKISLFDGLLVMGGPMGVYEPADIFPSRDDEIAAVKEAVKQKIPILGLCLGSQLLAHALGAKVHPNIQKGKHVKEIGYYRVHLTSAGQKSPLFRGFSDIIDVLQWHGDTFDLPKDATHLATSPLCQNQAFSYRSAYGCLFHMEFTPEMVETQIEVDRKWIHKDFDIDETLLKNQAREYASKMKSQARKFFENFLQIIKNK